MVLVLQAEKASWNSIGIFKLSNISGKKRELVPTTKSTGDDSDMDGDGSDSDEDSENEEDGGSGTPILQVPFCFSNFICIVASIIIIVIHLYQFYLLLYLMCLLLLYVPTDAQSGPWGMC